MGFYRNDPELRRRRYFALFYWIWQFLGPIMSK